MLEKKSTTVKSQISNSSERSPAPVKVSKILVSIDFTRRSEQTIAYALQLARFWTAKILFLHVLPRVDEFASFPFYREIYSRFGSAEQKHRAAREKVDAASQAEMQKVTGGLQLPPGMKLPF